MVIRIIVIALGGNALIKAKQKGTLEQQLRNIDETAGQIATLVKQGHDVVLTHGNGPQVGAILIQQEEAKEIVPAMPLDVCVAESQGEIGYMLQKTFDKRLKARKPVVTIITQCVVDKGDIAFRNPTKPVGPFYTQEEAQPLMRKFDMVEDAGRGYRRVVPSPMPLEVVEAPVIKKLLHENVVIACGGGGIPVIREDGELKGVEAVIDKDLASAVLACELKADLFVILTGVEKVCLNYGKPDEKVLDHMTLAGAKQYLSEGHFPPGSMGPKIESAVKFLESGGQAVVITSLNNLGAAIKGGAGTWITKR
ncbi:MAG: carbamate kinase [Candidatus Diapherotrites archaeon]|nr:carbamate kinase [Candidatus Diapherotrites archaeon]